MSLKFQSTIKPERGAEYLVDIDDIAVDHASNNRFSQSDIGVLVQSISQYGQLEAVGAVREKPNNTLRLAYGFGRYEAIKRINAGVQEDQRMKIKVVVFDGNDRDVFFRNLAENAHRNNLSHMDYALSIRRMSENYGQTDSQIASFFGRTGGWVSQHRSLLSLDYNIQQKVHSGEINFTDALSIAKMSADKQKVAVKEIESVVTAPAPAEVDNNEDDNTDTTTITKNEADQPEETTPAKKKRAVKEIIRKLSDTPKNNKRTWGEMYSFFDVMVGSPAISDELQKLAGVMLAIMSGGIHDDSEAVEALEAIMGGKE
jgi:ParB/RepB/Spo0J family partition protein